MVAVGVAAIVAAAFGAIEQITRFRPPRKITLRHGAWRFWTLRALLEAATAAVVTGVAQELGVAETETWWGGALAGLATAAGLRSSFMDVGELPIGLRSAFDPFRTWLDERLLVSVAVATSAAYANEHLPAVRESPITDIEIGSRLKAFIQDYGALSPGERKEKLVVVDDLLADEATPASERKEALLELARELGGDELTASIAASASDKQRPELHEGEG